MITGTVVDKSGEPVAAAAISFSGSPVPVPDIALLSAADGSFALNAPIAGHYRIAVRADERLVDLPIDVPAVGEAGLRVEV